MLFTLMQVIGMLTVIRGVPERLNEAASCADNLVCLTNYVQAREINCATFCWRRWGLWRVVFWHERRYEKAIWVASPAAQLLSAGSGCHNGL